MFVQCLPKQVEFILVSIQNEFIGVNFDVAFTTASKIMRKVKIVEILSLKFKLMTIFHCLFFGCYTGLKKSLSPVDYSLESTKNNQI